MRQKWYNLFLIFLRGLVYPKRALGWFFLLLYSLIEKGVAFFWKTIGFRLYQLKFSIQRQIGWLRSPGTNQTLEILSRRGVLQVVLLLSCFFVLFPQTKLYTRDAFKIPGKDTLLFSLVGPGEQDFATEELVFNQNYVDSGNTVSWRDATVGGDSFGTAISGNSGVVSEISGISTGGLALTKPNILPGSTLPVEGINEATGRTDIIVYEVKPGDVIGKIAQSFNISVETILWANNLTTRSYIRPGDKLKILPVSGIAYQVKKGDNIGKIARLYGVSSDSIIKTNLLQKDGSDIAIGENLIIPGGRKIEPTVVRTVASSANSSFRQISAPPPSVDAPAGAGYLWPTAARIITQYYGWRHTGLDIATNKPGTPNYAAKAGTVIKSQCGWNGGYGCYVIIDHGNGVQTLYGHHSQLNVAVGDHVVQGQVIGIMGNTGKSTGPHLHFEIRVNGVKQNPLKYIR